MSWLQTRTLLGVACAVLLTGAAQAQAGTAVVDAAAAQSPQDKLDELIRRYNKQQNEVYEAYEKATTDAEREQALKGRPGKEFVPEFRAVAEEAKGTDTALKAWMWVLRLVQDDAKQGWEIVQRLLAEHMGSPALNELSTQLRNSAWRFGEAETIEALRAIVADTPHDPVRADALFALGGVLLDSNTPQGKTEGRECLEAILADYGDLAYRGSTYAQAAAGYLYELDHLQIGMVAPDFETVDENGAKWKLSDYRGKVVVVDFWGYW